VDGEMKSHILKNGGEKIAVTNENKMEYITLYSDYILNQRTKEHAKVFRDGFITVVNDKWL
jgi:hypothetical protein